MILLRVLFSAFLAFAATTAAADDLIGAWETTRDDGATGVAIVTDRHFALAWYQKKPSKFISTEGGSWTRSGEGTIVLKYEFQTADPSHVGMENIIPAKISGDTLDTADFKWKRIDSGAPGELQGSWLMTGARREGEIRTREPGARRTMKILSGTRFQWIAYNVETKEFFGSGGGTYTTADGKYTENIEFFSRDDSRSGMSLPFKYSLDEGAWHHDGNNSKGEPMYEIWTRREKLGI
jgi:hypothetical protein